MYLLSHGACRRGWIQTRQASRHATGCSLSSCSSLNIGFIVLQVCIQARYDYAKDYLEKKG